LPDALDVIVVCLEAGLSISGALSRVARELGSAHPLLAQELGIVEREIQMGRSTGDAMRQLAVRFDLEELRSLAAVIKQSEQFGTSVVKAFNVYAESIRVQRHQRAEELARKAAIKILFPTVLCIFPGIFIVLLGPAAIRIYNVLILGVRHGTL
jgi:tight adherence protein C